MASCNIPERGSAYHSTRFWEAELTARHYWQCSGSQMAKAMCSLWWAKATKFVSRLAWETNRLQVCRVFDCIDGTRDSRSVCQGPSWGVRTNNPKCHRPWITLRGKQCHDLKEGSLWSKDPKMTILSASPVLSLNLNTIEYIGDAVFRQHFKKKTTWCSSSILGVYFTWTRSTVSST